MSGYRCAEPGDRQVVRWALEMVMAATVEDETLGFDAFEPLIAEIDAANAGTHVASVIAGWCAALAEAHPFGLATLRKFGAEVAE